MITDAQREAAKAHGFKFYERQAGRVEEPSMEEKKLTTFEQVRSTVRHLREVLHHPDWIVVDLLLAQAERYGSPEFIAACKAVAAECWQGGKPATKLRLDALCALDSVI